MRSAWAVLLISAMASGTSLAADPPSNNVGSPGDSWRSIARLPDWSGVWELDWRSSFTGAALVDKKLPQLTPRYAASFAKYQAAQTRGEEEQTEQANCVPPGMPGIMTQPYPIEFLFTPGKVTIAIEAYSQMRRVFTDGRTHPADPDPTFAGHSVGHWEGDTLVVDTVGVLPGTSLAPGIQHSSQLRIEERIRRISDDTLQIHTTFRDPEALAEPWQVVRTYVRHRDWDIKEYVCTQNNRDSADSQGRAGINIER